MHVGIDGCVVSSVLGWVDWVLIELGFSDGQNGDTPPDDFSFLFEEEYLHLVAILLCTENVFIHHGVTLESETVHLLEFVSGAVGQPLTVDSSPAHSAPSGNAPNTCRASSLALGCALSARLSLYQTRPAHREHKVTGARKWGLVDQRVCHKPHKGLSSITMKEHSILKIRELLEAKPRKLVRVKKNKAQGPRIPSVSHIFKQAKMKKLPSGNYSIHGVHIVVDQDRRALIECPECGMLFDSYLDHQYHHEKFH